MKKQKKEQEVEIEGFGKEISDLKSENLKSSKENAQLFKENQLLNEKVSALSSTNESDKNTIKLMDEEINQLRTNVFEAESFIFEQHKLGFEKALQQAKYFYKILIDEGNFDVKKDFYNGELIPANEIPDNDAEDINIENYVDMGFYVYSFSVNSRLLAEKNNCFGMLGCLMFAFVM